MLRNKRVPQIIRHHNHTLKVKGRALLLFTFLSFLMAACSSTGNRFKLEGQFKNINQGEFYLYDINRGQLDTLTVRDGRFIYEVEMRDTAVLTLMFPNYSELPIIATPGSHIKVVGDVSHLKETQVNGSDENEQMTAFRQECNELMPPAVKQKAEQFITKHPESPICEYLLRKYIIQATDVNYAQAADLCNMMLKARSNNSSLALLAQQLEQLKHLKTNGKLPSFKAKSTDGKAVSDSLLNKQANVILVWASWNYDSQNALRQVQTLYKKHRDSISVVSISMDASSQEGVNTLNRDSILWPNICDGMLWDSPLVGRLGISYVPDNIIINRNGHIVGRSLSTRELTEKIESLLQ